MRRLSRHWIAIVASAVVVLGAAGPAGAASSSPSPPYYLPPLADIPMFRMDARRSAIAPGPGPNATPTIAWSRDLDSPISTLPVLVAGLIIVGDQGGELVALDARTGAERWRTGGSGSFSGTPAAEDGIVVAADATGILAVDALDGTIRWRREIATEAPRLVIDGGVVYLGTTDGAVKGFDVETGEDRWSWQGDHGLSVRVDAVADGIVYANPNDGQVIALDLADGTERWRVRGRVARLSYEVAGDTFFFYNPGDPPVGEISAVDIGSGRVRWRFAPPSGGQTTAGPVQDGILYVNTVSDGLYALSDQGDTYAIVWHIDFAPVYFPMALSGGVLYGVDGDGAPFALRAADGSLLWHGDGTGASALPLVSGGMLLDAEINGLSTVRAFADPSLIAQLPTPVTQASPSLAPTLAATATSPFTIVGAFPWEDTGIGTPLGMAAGPDGLLYVFDTDPKVTVIDPADGHVVRRWGQQGAGPGEFDVRRPDDNPGYGDIAVAPDGRVYVADGSNHRVQVFAPDGTFLSQFGSFGTGEGQFGSIEQLAIGPDGSVYVQDGLFSKFTADGKFLWRTDFLFGFVVRPDGVVLGTCWECDGIMLLDPDDGQVIDRWPWPGDGDGGAGLLSLDPAGNVYDWVFSEPSWSQAVLDPEGHRIAQVWPKDPGRGARTITYGDLWNGSPVFLPDGRAFAFGEDGVLELEVTLPTG